MCIPGPCDERLLRIGKVSGTASEVRNNIGKKSISSIEAWLREESEIPKHGKIYRST